MTNQQDIVAEAMRAAFGDMWDRLSTEAPTSSSCPMFPSLQESCSQPTKVRAVTSVIAPHIAGTPLYTESMEPRKRKRPPRTKHTDLHTPLPFTAPHSSTSLAPLTSSLAPPNTSLATASHIAPSLIAPSLPPPVSSLDDPMSYLLETFDTLIAPQLPNPGNTSSSMALRRCLYRKQFYLEASKQLQVPFTSVEQLIPIIASSCAKCGIILV